jgi:cytochrome c biogenesis protein CcmG, thiol:disulfide interchange protein DsbE
MSFTFGDHMTIKMTRRSTLVLGGALVASVLLGYLLWIYGKHYTPAKIGDVAPNIDAVATTGQPFSLDNLRGEPVLLDFFTPWCAPCIAETPDLIAFAKQYGQKVHVVLIDRGDGEGFVRQYVEKYHTPTDMTVLFNPNDNWSTQYGVTGQPETFFISADGKIVLHTVGPLSQVQMTNDAKAAGMPAT